jgi:pectate lyase
MKRLLYLLPLFALSTHAMAQIAAFPGAQGGGAASVGGRGGAVMEITNTNDSGAGSRRACLQGSGPRTCIYRVAGLFPVTSGDVLVSNPFVTDACHTAPGEVIIGGPNTNGAALRVSTHDVIVRGCVFSPDNASTVSGPDSGTVGIAILNCSNITQSLPPAPPANSGCYNIIFDHVTTRWSGNKSWITGSNFTPTPTQPGVGPNHSITTQWSLDYEPHEGHPVGFGTATDESCVSSLAKGGCLSAYETDIDFHHNVLVNIDHRIPENSNRSTRWNSNIIYNWGTYANQFLGAETIDLINNKYITGNLNGLGAQPHPVHFTMNSPELCGTPSGYMSGNIWGPPGTNTVNANPWSLAVATNGENAQSETDPNPPGGLCPQATNTPGIPVPSSWQRSSPMSPGAFPIVADPAATLDTLLLPTVGASQHLDCNGNWFSHRDPQDKRILQQYQTGAAGGYWPNGVTFAGQPTFPPPLPNWTDTPVVNGTVCVESQHDGIPDQWKKANGYSTTDPNLHNQVLASGYTILETYLAGSGVTPPPVNPVSPNGATITPGSGGSLTDASGNTWTLGAAVPVSSNPDCSPLSCGNVIIKNGTTLTGTAATLVLWYNSFIYQENAAGNWWQYTAGGTFVKVGGDPRPPVTHPTVTCIPNSIQTGGTSTCTSNQIVVWSASIGTITPAGIYTAPAMATTATITGSNANGAGTVPITVTAIPPPVCPALPVKVAITVGGVSIGSMTCTANAAGVYSCSIP